MLLPYIADPDSPLVYFVRNYVHRKCFDAWEKHDEFVQGSFELEERMMKEGYYEDVILCDRYFMIDYRKREDSFCIRDCFSAFEIRIKMEQVREIGDFFEKIGKRNDSKLELEELMFTVKDKDVLIVRHDKDEINDEIIIPRSRINDYIMAFKAILEYPKEWFQSEKTKANN